MWGQFHICDVYITDVGGKKFSMKGGTISISFLRSVWFLYVDVSNRLLPAPLSLFIRQAADPVTLDY
jgi:hypothetical protein